jgi:gliding motility-associated-like protein
MIQLLPVFGQNCEVDFPGTAVRTFSGACGGSSSANLTLGKNTYMGNGDIFVFDAPAIINITGNIDVNAQGSGKIVIPAGVRVNLGGNFKLDSKNSGCTSANPCTFEIEVNGYANFTHHFDNNIVTLVWSGTGTVVVDDKLKNSSNGCMECAAGGCPTFQVNSSDCTDDGSGCSDSDFCAAILNPCSSDETDPVITGCSDITVNANASCQAVVSWNAPSFTDNCPDASITLTTSKQPGSTFAKGTTVVSYKATDAAGNIATCSFNVNVVDNVLPVITGCPADITVNANASCQAVVNWTVPSLANTCAGVTLTSNKTPGSTFATGVTVVTYTARDADGRTTTCSFDVSVVDAPSFTGCPSDIIKDATDAGTASVDWMVPTAQAACDDFQMISTHRPGDVFPIGQTLVEYTATTDNGAFSSCSFTVTITIPEIVANEVITPDGDNKNDVWLIENIEEFPDNHVIIFDRWGSSVFKANAYNNSSISWNGQNVPTGTYYYTLIVKMAGSKIEKKGFVELVK